MVTNGGITREEHGSWEEFPISRDKRKPYATERNSDWRSPWGSRDRVASGCYGSLRFPVRGESPPSHSSASSATASAQPSPPIWPTVHSPTQNQNSNTHTHSLFIQSESESMVELNYPVNADVKAILEGSIEDDPFGLRGGRGCWWVGLVRVGEDVGGEAQWKEMLWVWFGGGKERAIEGPWEGAHGDGAPHYCLVS